VEVDVAEARTAVAAYPELARWAERGALFEAVRSQSSWTKMSMAALLTSLWPRTHGIREAQGGPADEALTLAEVLQDAGYATYGVQTNGWLHQSFGTDSQGACLAAIRWVDDAVERVRKQLARSPTRRRATWTQPPQLHGTRRAALPRCLRAERGVRWQLDLCAQRDCARGRP